MNTDAKVWVNGELLSFENASISPLDRGFTLGDGLFETMRVRDGKILRLDRHLARLRHGAGVIGLQLLWTDYEFTEAIKKTLDTNQLRDAFVRLTVTRGVPTVRGLIPDKDPSPSVVVQCGQFSGYPPDLYQRGMRVIVSSVRRNEYSPLANIKSLNYLDNILARQEAVVQGVDDGLMLNTAGELVCASAANLFFVREKTLFTAPLSAGALPGTLRADVIEALAPALDLKIVEQAICPDDIASMDEAFLTNTLMGIMPLTHVSGHPLGSGEPGQITSDLHFVLGAE